MSQAVNGLKGLWESFPFAPELYWRLILRGSLEKQPRINRLSRNIAKWVSQARDAKFEPAPNPKKVLLFTSIPSWMMHSSLLAVTYTGMGHQVTLAYLPQIDWFTEMSDYQLRLRDIQLAKVFQSADGYFEPVSWYQYPASSKLPSALSDAVEQVCVRDYLYTHQVEEVDQHSSFYAWRLKSNFAAAKAAYEWISQHRPDVVLVPNGLILEFGVVFEVARQLGIPTVTYEFGEQVDRIWLAKNQPVMFQDTDEMWAASKDLPFTDLQRDRIERLYASRMQAGLWQNFTRQWQEAPVEGGQAVREKLQLDDRPLVLMAANVIGDSLTLGRQVFSTSMTEWIERTLAHFSERPGVQFVLRIHPGERYTNGPSVEDIVRQRLPEIPDHIRIISSGNPVNTYDLISAADLGIVYTTTVGMEMAMLGLPAVVVGRTHYRGRGFTFDPQSWEAYFDLLETAVASQDGLRLTRAHIDRAWHYAYNFFFEYPQPFPWHLHGMAQHMEALPPGELLSDETLHGYRSSFDLLLGETVPWKDLIGRGA